MTDLPLPMPDIMPNEEDAVFDDSSRFIRVEFSMCITLFAKVSSWRANQHCVRSRDSCRNSNLH